METIIKIPVEQVFPDDTHGNDRKVFDEAELRELGENIAKRGQLQPCRVVRVGDRYRLVMGERRWRACKLVGIPTVSAIVSDGDEYGNSMAMLVENACRVNLDPIEEANAFALRIEQFGIDAETLSKETGINIRRIRNRLPLVSLAPDIQDLVRTGNLPITYAVTLANMGLDVNRQRIAIARYRENPAPTPEWFRAQCSLLGEQQAQESLFALPDAPIFTGVAEEFISVGDGGLPPDPLKDTLPIGNGSVMATLSTQKRRWENAARQWHALGKTAQAKRCLAAANVLDGILVGITSERPRF